MKKQITLVSLIIFLIVGIINSFGQTYEVKGTVYNSATKEPIEKLQVSLKP